MNHDVDENTRTPVDIDQLINQVLTLAAVEVAIEYAKIAERRLAWELANPDAD